MSLESSLVRINLGLLPVRKGNQQQLLKGEVKIQAEILFLRDEQPCKNWETKLDQS